MSQSTTSIYYDANLNSTIAQLLCNALWQGIFYFVQELHFMELFFISLQNIYNFTCQVLFFIFYNWATTDGDLAEIADKNKSVVQALSTILFFTVFTYFIKQVNDICIKSPIHTVHNRTRSDSFIKFVCKLILEWIKALLVVICLREQGIEYNPTTINVIVTFLYYIATDQLYLQILPTLLEHFALDIFENLEHLYVPLILNLYAVFVGIVFQCYLITFYYSNLILIGFYFLTYLRLKDCYFNYWKMISSERKVYASFKSATSQEISHWNDICAVCLNSISKGKITPCKHLFHSYCLKQCLKSSFCCPLCKTNFLLINEL